MKRFIDDQGKICGLINPLDLLVILILFFLGIVLLQKYQPEPLNIQREVAVYGILVRNTPPYVAASIRVGQELIQDPAGISLGVIYQKASHPAEIMLHHDGKLSAASSPRNLDLRLELRRYARVVMGPSQYGVYVNRLPLRVGAPVRAHTLYTQITGEIEFLKVVRHGKPSP